MRLAIKWNDINQDVWRHFTLLGRQRVGPEINIYEIEIWEFFV